MADFAHQDLTGSTFERVDLTGSLFQGVDFTNARIRIADFSGAVMTGVDLVNVQISGDLMNVVVNGVDIAPLVEAELNRREPDRAKMRPGDPAGFAEAWGIIERRWESTVARARTFAPEQLHESVNDEWSFIQTLRHLVYATDAWVRRAMLGDPAPWDPLDLPWDEAPDLPGTPRDRDARPSLEEVLTLRRSRMDTVREVIAGLTPESLAADTTPVDAPGWPPPQAFPVRECLLTVLNEEWLHRQFAERDLDVLAGR
jgi:hypothetical protein